MAGWIKMPLGRDIGLNPSNIVLDGDPAPPSPKKGAEPPPISGHVYRGQTAGWIKMPLGMDVRRPQPRPHCGRWGPSSPKKAHSPPNFQPCLLWPNVWMDQNATRYRGTPRPRPHCVRWGPSSPWKGAQPRTFSAHVYYGQMAGWIKMSVGMKVGLVPGNSVRGGPSPPWSTVPSPIFGPCLLWPNG